MDMKHTDGGILIPTQLRETIEERATNTSLHYNTETGAKEFFYNPTNSLVVRLHPRWKFWKSGWLIKCKTSVYETP